MKLKLIRSILFVITLSAGWCAAGAQSRHDAAGEIDRKVEELLSRMTLEEKVGQMTQFTNRPSEAWRKANPDKAEGPLPIEGHAPMQEYSEAIREGRIGSFLNLVGAELTNRVQRIAVEESRLGIPLLFGYDVIHGYRTIFPIPLAEAATWNPELVEQAAAVAAAEGAAAGIHWTFAPMVDIARDPRWGRVAEGSGEDPYLGSVMAVARVRGFQGSDISAPDRLLACAKHYVGYGAAEAGRDYATTEISERTLREVYLPPFKAALEAGVGSFMTGFNDLNGIPVSAHRYLIEDILRKEWGFQGFLVSDYESILELVPHGIAADPADAARLGAIAGLDMDMEAGVYMRHLPELVRKGLVPQSVIDDAVRRILRAKFQLGLFERPYVDPSREKEAFLRPENVALARRVAQQSIVLLKNDRNTLPLRGGLQRIAVIGPLADSKPDMLGTWAAQGRAEDAVTVLDALRARLPKARIEHAHGVDAAGDSTKGIAPAVRLARRAQAVILVMGEPAEMSGEAASRAYLDLPGRQRELVEAVLKTGTPAVMVLMNGRPLTIEWAAETVPAILEAWHLGIQAGPAVVDVLFGDANPAGRLPVTFPRTVGQVPIYYAQKNTGRPPSKEKYTAKYLDVPVTPLYPFGYGLSYTEFRYSNLTLGADTMSPGGEISISVDVENVGARDGEEVVQLYVRNLVASITRPMKELKGFQRVAIAAGEKQTVRFTLQSGELAFYDQEMKRVVEPGAFHVWVGPNSAEGVQGQFVLSPE